VETAGGLAEEEVFAVEGGKKRRRGSRIGKPAD
jgi:hypothetical protein